MTLRRFLAATLLVAALAAPAAAQKAQRPPAPAAPVVVPDNVYTGAQQLVAVDGDRRLNLYCMGSGDPTVMLEAGAGNSMVTWRLVQGEIAKTTRVCAYDRAGLGFSDPATRSSDVRNMADDLERLVTAAKVGKPFVLVGHSLGAEIAVMAAATAPQDVAGMVLVDPAFADDLDALQAALPPEKRNAIGDAMARALDLRRTCRDDARDGKLAKPSSPIDRACVDASHDPNRLDRALVQQAHERLADAKFWDAEVSEMAAVTPEGDHIDTNSAELGAINFDFGAKPLIVLSRGVGEGAPGVPRDAVPRVEAAWITGHATLAARSKRGEHVIVPEARHYIQIDRPEAVVQAVAKVVKEVKGD